MGEWGKELLKLLFPPRCAVCDGLLSPGEHKGGVHQTCVKYLTLVGDHVCMHCGQPLEQAEREYCYDCGRRIAASHVSQGRAVFEYRGPLKQMMYRFKYANRREYAAFMADAACRRWGGWIVRSGAQAVIPVPMYRAKQRRRGYNQAALFAQALAGQTGLVYEQKAVRRIRNTRPQKALNDVERKNNLKNAFQSAEFIVKYKKVLLVDDIYTTGSTAEAVAQSLRQAGVEEVYFLAVCIGQGL